MSDASAGTFASASVGAAVEAIKASGAIVRLEPDDFVYLLSKCRDPLVVANEGGIFTKSYQYLFGYKGLVFYTKSREELPLPSGAELVYARKIWIPF